ncbi:hypothetical protein [Tenacibaculum crassostreae]|uniref:hypothetical protein n=1 Tax=Tenacibaculum crassostreae TaxID=502683 RepID=UPI003894AB67
MKPQKTYLIILLTLFICSCKNDIKKEAATINKTSVVKNVIKTVSTIENLQNITPINLEEFKTWFPSQLINMQKVSVVAAPLSANDISGTVAKYQGDKTNKMQITLYDCAGKNGAMILGQYTLYKNMKVDNESAYKIEKSFTKNGMMGVETFHKDRKFSDISFLYRDRLALNIKAYETDREMVWKAIEDLKLKKLINN